MNGGGHGCQRRHCCTCHQPSVNRSVVLLLTACCSVWCTVAATARVWIALLAASSFKTPGGVFPRLAASPCRHVQQLRLQADAFQPLTLTPPPPPLFLLLLLLLTLLSSFLCFAFTCRCFPTLRLLLLALRSRRALHYQPPATAAAAAAPAFASLRQTRADAFKL